MKERFRDLATGPAGIRDGGLVDDFHIIQGERSIHVCNAPSPAATASIEIGIYVAEKAASGAMGVK